MLDSSRRASVPFRAGSNPDREPVYAYLSLEGSKQKIAVQSMLRRRRRRRL